MKTEHIEHVQELNREAHVVEQDTREEKDMIEQEVNELRSLLLQVQLESNEREEKENEAENLTEQIAREGQ